jgi:hypothetical protein
MDYQQLCLKVKQFEDMVGEQYELCQNVSADGLADVVSRYLPRIVGSPDCEKQKIVDYLIQDWPIVQQSYHAARQWGRAMLGVTNYLFLPQDMDSANVSFAVDACVRLSRWARTDGSFFIERRPDAHAIFTNFWGGPVPDLYGSYGGQTGPCRVVFVRSRQGVGQVRLIERGVNNCRVSSLHDETRNLLVQTPLLFCDRRCRVPVSADNLRAAVYN